MAGRSSGLNRIKTVLAADPRNLGGYVGRYFRDMEKQIEDSEDDGLEHGTSFCYSEDGITMLSPCTGDKCSIRLPVCARQVARVRGIPTGPFGTFHVHPNGNVEPSTADLLVSLKDRERISCIGATQMVTRSVEGRRVKVPITIISCRGLDIDNREFSGFQRKMSPPLRKALDLKNRITDKHLLQKTAASKKEWKEYFKLAKNIRKAYDESDMATEEGIIHSRLTSSTRWRSELAKVSGRPRPRPRPKPRPEPKVPPKGFTKSQIAYNYIAGKGAGATITPSELARATGFAGGASSAWIKNAVKKGFLRQPAPRQPYVITGSVATRSPARLRARHPIKITQCKTINLRK